MAHAFEFLLPVDGPFWKVDGTFIKCSLAGGRISAGVDFVLSFGFECVYLNIAN